MTTSQDGNLLVVDNHVPFGDVICVQLELERLQLDRFAPHGSIEQHYLAWETVRKARNPFLANGTGFEGYFVGVYESPEEVFFHILRMSQDILDAITRFYRSEYSFRSRLIKTLTREMSDPRSMYIWSTYLGGALARLRCQVAKNQYAGKFREQTYKMLENLPPMHYQMAEHDILQHFAIRRDLDSNLHPVQVSASDLKGSQQDAWMVAENIGEFGHPLIRQYLHEFYNIYH